jgi:predicted enzyme related to lactoylglutathione lyase
MEKREQATGHSLVAMNLSISHCFITVLDQDAALDFYTNVMGLEARTDAEFEGMRWLTVGPPSQPDVEIALLTPPAFLPEEDREQMSSLVAKGVMGTVIFRTDDVRGDFDRIAASGAEVTQEPTEMPYGVIDCAVRDPSGNHLRLAQALAPAAG